MFTCTIFLKSVAWTESLSVSLALVRLHKAPTDTRLLHREIGKLKRRSIRSTISGDKTVDYEMFRTPLAVLRPLYQSRYTRAHKTIAMSYRVLNLNERAKKKGAIGSLFLCVKSA
jgi:hypothetical protein